MTDDPIHRSGLRHQFWKRFALNELPLDEWEALCDGCGRCCMLKLEDEETGKIAYTNIACRLFDDTTCRCGNYALRQQLVKTCVHVQPENLEEILEWMPLTCAYRMVSEGKPLPDWHPLISGTRDSVDKVGISMHKKTIPEFDVGEDDWLDHTIKGIL
ncbi:MAG: YcgN family cysteine cluster protein [Paracoccaceae bacterium]